MKIECKSNIIMENIRNAIILLSFQLSAKDPRGKHVYAFPVFKFFVFVIAYMPTGVYKRSTVLHYLYL